MGLPAIQDTEQRLTMSFEEFLNFGDDTIHAEWVNGEVIIFMTPDDRHQELIVFLVNLLDNFVKLFNLGAIRAAPSAMRLTNSAREPDVMFIAQENMGRLTKRMLEGPADLAIEVVSPSSVKRDRVEKFAEYAAEGVREYWVIDPRPHHQTADFYHLTGAGTYRAATLDDDGRFHSEVLPGFWLDPDWLRQDPLPNPLRLLLQIAPDALRAALDEGTKGD